jgi:hypothetical protein
MKTVNYLTASEIRQRLEKMHDSKEVQLVFEGEYLPLKLGFNCYDDLDWTEMADIELLLDEMADDEQLRFFQYGRSVVVVDVEDDGELIVEEI